MLRRLLFWAPALPLLLPAQADFRVYTEHPRLFLEPDRLRRLEREVERESPRWRRLAELAAERAPLVEPDVAHALIYRLTGHEASADEAIGGVERALAAGTLGSPGRLRQAALVFDWCYDRLTAEQRLRLAEAIGEESAARTELAGSEIEPVRDGVLGLIAVADDWEGTEPALGRFLNRQWEQDIVPLLRAGELTDQAEPLIALLEISHAVRDNLERNLWADAPGAFDPLPESRVLSYAPGSVETDEGRVRLTALGPSDPEAARREAVLGRIAEMIYVAYAPSPRGSQFLQGWLHNDGYRLTGPLGALYEFLWLNPYLPGLSPSAGLTLAYDRLRGRLFARTGWDEDDYRLSYSKAGLRVLRGSGEEVPLDADYFTFPGATVARVAREGKYTIPVEGADAVPVPRIYLVGLEGGRRYNLRINRDEWRIFSADPGGIIEVFSDPMRDIPEINFSKPVRIQIRPTLEDPPGRKPPTLR